jgi:hypothetical protein
VGPGGDAATNGPANVDALELPGANYYPESLGVDPSNGTLYVGSITTGEVIKFAPGQIEGTPFLAPGTVTGVAGVLVDPTMQSLLVCVVNATTFQNSSVQRYDLATGHLKATFSFPTGVVAFADDMAFDSAHKLYVTDLLGAKVYRVDSLDADGAMAVWASDPLLAPPQNGFGADGISFDGSSNFYVNNFGEATILRIPLNSDGTAGTVAALTLSTVDDPDGGSIPALTAPDGQRQLDANTLLVVDGARGTLAKVAISGTTGTVTYLDTRLDSPTSVVVYGNYYWVTEGQLLSSFATGGRVPPNLPFLVERVDAY